MKPYLLIASLAIAFASCTVKEDEEQETPVVYSSLRYGPDIDSTFLSANGETMQLTLQGTILNTTQTTIKNSGVITETQYTVTTVDTVYQSVDPAKAQWSSSNTNAATVSNGLITARAAGSTTISAVIGGARTKGLAVTVRAVDVAPGLMLDPPSMQLVLTNSVTVSGSVQNTALLSVSEPRSGTDTTGVPYSSTDGRFSVAITGLQTGLSIVSVTAANVNNVALTTRRVKNIYFYVFGSPGADSIVGDWMGNTLGKNFPFAIQKSIIYSRYDITGRLDIRFDGVGLVRDIDIIGIVNNDGTITASLSKSYEGFTVSGSFGGKFKTTGTADGSYSARIEKAGWPKISFKADWTAEKVR